MTAPQSTDKKKSSKTLGIVLLVAIICIIIVISVYLFHPLQNSPAQNISPSASTVSATSVVPSSGDAGTLVPVTLAGNFSYGPSPSVWLSKEGSPELPAQDVVVVSPTHLNCVFPLTASSVSAGQWDVYVKNFDEQSGSKVGTFTVRDDHSPLLKWDWSADGWNGWQYRVLCKGTAGKTGYCLEYGPVIVDGHGKYGSNVTYSLVSTESRVSKTFTASSGRWNTLTFTGVLSASDYPKGRTMVIDVNGNQVYSATAATDSAINGKQFTITRTFDPTNKVTITITSGQNPTLHTSLFTLQFNSLTLS